MNVINDFKEYDTENLSDIDSVSSEKIQDIDDYLDLDYEKDDSFISPELTENTLQKLLQEEMEFYSTAFPQATLSQKFLR